MLSSDFHYKENDGTTGAAHLIQTSFLAISPDIRRIRSLANHRRLYSMIAYRVTFVELIRAHHTCFQVGYCVNGLGDESPGNGSLL